MIKIKERKLFIAVASVLLIAIIIGIALISNNDNKTTDIILFRCNGADITLSVYKMYVFQCASELKNETFDTDEEYYTYREEFWKTEIDGKMPVDIVKEKALEAIKTYAFYTSECNKNKIIFDGEALQFFKSAMEVQFKDTDTVEMFGVEKEHYISYLADIERFDSFINTEVSKISVTDKSIEDKFNEMREQYAKITVKTIFVKYEEGKDINEKSEYINNIKSELDNGAEMDVLIEQYSEYKGDNNGTFEITNSSSIKDEFGDEYITGVLKSNTGDVEILRTSTGYCLNQTIKVERTDEAYEELRKYVQEEIYANRVMDIIRENPEMYKVIVLEQELFNSIELPYIFTYKSQE